MGWVSFFLPPSIILKVFYLSDLLIGNLKYENVQTEKIFKKN